MLVKGMHLSHWILLLEKHLAWTKEVLFEGQPYCVIHQTQWHSYLKSQCELVYSSRTSCLCILIERSTVVERSKIKSSLWLGCNTPGTTTCYQTWAWVCRSSQQPCFTNTSDKVPQASVQTLIKWLKIIILGKNELQGNPFWHKKNDTMELGRWMDRDCTVREKNTNTEGITVIDEVQTMTTATKAWEA